jgi:hypothetical protein
VQAALQRVVLRVDIPRGNFTLARPLERLGLHCGHKRQGHSGGQKNVLKLHGTFSSKFLLCSKDKVNPMGYP